ncbi:MAG: hypothetical protein PHQ12_04775 [Chthoniobacteraceae bacterium]|nr:hypothetical protein [Chthoniobacteraceae bacterium]
MKISIGDVQIVNTSDGSGSAVTGLLPPIDRQVEVKPLLRAATPAVFDRGNKATAVAFRVSLPCGSPAAACYIFFSLEASIPAYAPLIITPHNTTATITIPGTLKSIHPSMVGSRLTLDFTFQGQVPALDGFVLSTENGITLTDEAGTKLID